MPARIESQNYAERWIADAFQQAIIPASCVSREVDMFRCMALLEKARQPGRKDTATPLLVRAAALALVRLPDLHRMNIGNRRYIYDRADICLSVAGKTAAAPTLVLRDASRRTWTELAEEIRAEARNVRQRDNVAMDRLRRWGWIVPFSAWRRMILRQLGRIAAIRNSKVGTFQVSVLTGVDVCAAFQFGTAGMLLAGEVRDRAVVLDGKPATRPTIVLTCAFNHRVWDAEDAMRFLAEVSEILEGGELERESYECIS